MTLAGVLQPLREMFDSLELPQPDFSAHTADHTIFNDIYGMNLINPTKAAYHALCVYDAVDDDTSRMWALLGLCRSLCYMGYRPEAKDIFTEMFKVHQAPQDALFEACTAWVDYGIYSKDKDSRGLEPALTVFAERDPLMRARCRLHMLEDEFYWKRNNYPHFVEEAAEIRAYFEENDLWCDVGLVIIYTLNDIVLAGERRRAREILDELQTIVERYDADFLRFFLMMQSAELDRIEFNQADAYQTYMRVMKLADDFQWRLTRVYARYGLASMAPFIGRSEDGLRYAEEGLELAHAIMSDIYVKEGYMHIGENLMYLGYITAADQALDQALAVEVKKEQQGTYHASTLIFKAEIAFVRGDFKATIDYLQEARHILEGYETCAMQRMWCMGLMMLTWYTMGKQQEADALKTQLQAYADTIDVPAQAIGKLSYMAFMLADTGRFEDAQMIIEDLDDESLTPILRSILTLARIQIDFAQLLANSPKGIIDQNLDAFYEGFATLIGDFEDAGLIRYLVSVKLNLAHIAARQERLALAHQHLDEIRAYDQNFYSDAYLSSVEAFIAETANQRDAAYAHHMDAVIKLSKARSTLYAGEYAGYFANTHNHPNHNAFAFALERNDYNECLACVEAISAQTMRAHLQVELTIENLLGASERVEMRMRELYGDDWTILRYASIGGVDVAFTIMPNDLVMEVLSSPRDLIQVLGGDQDYRMRYKPYRLNPKRVVKARLQEAYEYLPNALTKRLGDKDHRLIVIRSGNWHGVPFQAFMNKQGIPLLNLSTISYGESLLTLETLLNKDPVDNMSGLVVAESEFKQAGFNSLNSPLQESIFLDSYDYVNFEGIRNETNLADVLALKALNDELKEYGYLHISTHTDDTADTWHDNGILFGDGTISIEAIKRWRLNANLVALPNCITGTGAWYAGDETVGLAQAFTIAGARSVLATQWHVKDSVTPGLMAHFYESMAEGHSPAEALAAAQRWLYEENPDDIYTWAPFHITGRG